ncbi:CPBP family intramembrane metalloprotease [Thalassococcus sp. CAU 1522]|uniref:CPBP family intramembrane metalloprotease n=1 Tax=Thalassococcus arenae TaxID=2851652 RepID=A0ABS6N5B4_9RHOB|nr:CPBP family intramembrane glutamic endopeptidase [Thalassococcus arenae]MBV2359195.1 CPBP family intramembrane metalloprotease [Thalassococcus arenae]
MNYAAFARLVAPARPSAQLWRLVLGVILTGAVTIGLSQSVLAIARVALDENAFWLFLAEVETARTPMGLLILLTSLGGMGLGAVLAARLLHRRGLVSLIGPVPLALRQALRVLGALALLYGAVALLPPWPLWSDTVPGVPPGLWLALLPVTLLALLIQTGSEELLFRGYLQSQLAARFRHPAIWIGVPSVLFAIGHYAPLLYGGNAVVVMLWALVFGVIAADLTARAGTLGPAIALHLVNNFIAIAVTSLQGEMSGLALRQLPFGAGDEAAVAMILPADLILLILGWLAARIALRV